MFVTDNDMCGKLMVSLRNHACLSTSASRVLSLKVKPPCPLVGGASHLEVAMDESKDCD